MNRAILAILAFMTVSSSASSQTLIPTEQLAQYFDANGIEYMLLPDYQGHGGTGDYMFTQTRDPLDSETIGVFFELSAGNSLSDASMHWAIGLRGPRPGSPLPDNYGGRGLALGHLGSFNACTDKGGFIEDFTAAEQGGQMQLTYCQDEPLQNYKTYRIDIHVSKLNVWVGIWAKGYSAYLGVVYTKIAEYSCIGGTGGPGGGPGTCPESPMDAGFGGLFIGSAFLDSGHTWSATNIHVAFF